MGDILYKSIDGNKIKRPIAYCRSHHRYLSKKQMKIHKCLSKRCTGLQKTDDAFWEERAKRKMAAKQRKKGCGGPAWEDKILGEPIGRREDE